MNYGRRTLLRIRILLLSILFSIAVGNGAIAHGGGLDGLGCHHDRKLGRYHCHRGQQAGEVFTSKEDALDALQSGDGTSSSPIKGSARVVDGDTIWIGKTKIRLHGIDAPEMKQTCRTKQDKEQRCGALSKQALQAMVQGQEVRCEGDELDRYKRLIAVCFVGSQDINKQMVADGWALAYRKYSTAYVKAERAAKSSKAGVWRTEFTSPWEWRQGQRSATSNGGKPAKKDDASGSCLIKGNISKSGKIYHTPESRWYAKTKINTSKGERWFCSAREAEAAGWRKPR